VVGLDGRLTETSEELVFLGEFDAVRQHMKFREGRSTVTAVQSRCISETSAAKDMCCMSLHFALCSK
jgi:hypothetical protein